jgi:hypothetical protein
MVFWDWELIYLLPIGYRWVQRMLVNEASVLKLDYGLQQFKSH